MKILKRLLFISLTILSVSNSMAQETNGASTKEVPSITFNGAEYQYRWSQAGQFEFTPAGQEDLNAWSDMLTVWIYPQAKSEEALAQVANQTLGNFQAAKAIIVTTSSIPKTDAKPAEHLLSGVLGNKKLLEFVSTRFLFQDKSGASMIYSHRIYGKDVGNAMSSWLEKNGRNLEAQLLGLDAKPILTSLKK